MSRTYRSKNYGEMRREVKAERKRTNRKYRHSDRAMLKDKNEDAECEPRTGTSGWLTH